MAVQKVVYGAGLVNGKVKVSSGVEYDIDAVVEATGDKNQQETEVKGDDELKATFIGSVNEELTINANAISFDVLQAITSAAYSSSANGLEQPLGTDFEKNPPFIELWAETTGKDSQGNNVVIKKVWHKVQIKTVKVNQALETELSVEMTGVAYQTSTTVAGANLPSKRIATLYAVAA